MAAGCGVMLLSFILGADARLTIQDPQKMQFGPTPAAEKLLRTVEDTKQPYKDRLAALDRLGERREIATVSRLLRLLPGESDVVTLRVVIVLGRIGDRRALTPLRKIQKNPNTDFPGKINTALNGTIRALENR